ncbi:MAG: NAD(P)/FAD-dependent oxidoreductase [Thermoplasmata archaeon]|nr:MAG: NAD(P)/FAD-dependent oxidoreductase [Thermoplasmata archaeon]
MMRYVIVGGGVAGTAAADAIRKRDPEGSITILTDEPYPLWSKIRLPELFSGSIGPKGLIIRKPQWYDRRDILLRTEVTVTEVDPEAKMVTTSSGDCLPYDKLLLATGGLPYVPPIKGSDRTNVYTIRKLEQAIDVYDQLRDLRRIVIIGGGTLGLELARNLLETKAEIHVVESHSRLLPTLTDPASSEMLHLRLVHMGIHVHHDCNTREITGGDAADMVVMEDGRELDCDAVIIATGMRANKSLAEDLGLEMERGIVVDDHMRTSLPDIYSAGDACEHRHVKYGSWRAAEEQGTMAGANMAGDPIVYDGTVPSKYVRVAGADVFSAGHLDEEGVLENKLTVDWENMVYKRIVLDGCRIVGSVMVGDLRDAQRVLRAIETNIDVCPYMDRIRTWDMEFVSEAVKGKE